MNKIKSKEEKPAFVLDILYPKKKTQAVVNFNYVTFIFTIFTVT